MSDDLQQARVEAAMRACVLSPEIPTGQRAHLVHLEGVLTIREQVDLEVVVEKVLVAADAHLPSVARIAETLDAHTLSRPNGGTSSVAWCDCSCGHREEMWGGTRDVVEARVKLHQAEAVRALFGEVAGDE